MSKAVLMSIRPKWVDLIASGQKTAEIRKSMPRLPLPFKVYIYMTKHQDRLIEVMKDGDKDYLGETYHGKPIFIKVPEGSFQYQRGMVVGEFLCDAISPLTFDQDGVPTLHSFDPAINWMTCVTAKEAIKYCGDTEKRGLLVWHISELKMYRYDEEKSLSDFIKPPCERKSDCCACPYWSFKMQQCMRNNHILTAPQSWCYVEDQA